MRINHIRQEEFDFITIGFAQRPRWLQVALEWWSGIGTKLNQNEWCFNQKV